MRAFIFKGYEFDPSVATASFRYAFDDGTSFEEKVVFDGVGQYNGELLDRALFLAFVLAGVSYYKTFPTPHVVFEKGQLDSWQSNFFNTVYQEGLSQFAYENGLNRHDLAQFVATTDQTPPPVSYQAEGVLALQSGGKDSLLTASMLEKKGVDYTSWYISNSIYHPALLSKLRGPLVTARRLIDRDQLVAAEARGGLNGHVPVTYIVAAYALIDAILKGAGTVLLSIGHEGEEPHEWIGGLPVNHQWSKTWQAEVQLSEYVGRYISPGLRVGSPLRSFSELKIAELFTSLAWRKYGSSFSSCNRANYQQGADNTQLKWCGECPKCANSFLLFAPFLLAEELKGVFSGVDLFTNPQLERTFRGLLGVDGVMKPFECVGEVDELRLAYHMARSRGGYGTLPFAVPGSSFEYEKTYDSQGWATRLVE